jgi:hypothetical protein
MPITLRMTCYGAEWVIVSVVSADTDISVGDVDRTITEALIWIVQKMSDGVGSRRYWILLLPELPSFDL